MIRTIHPQAAVPKRLASVGCSLEFHDEGDKAEIVCFKLEATSGCEYQTVRRGAGSKRAAAPCKGWSDGRLNVPLEIELTWFDESSNDRCREIVNELKR